MRGIGFPDMDTRLPLDIDIRLHATSILHNVEGELISLQYHETAARAEEFVTTYNEHVSGKHDSRARLDGERVLSGYSLLNLKHCKGGAPIPDYLGFRIENREPIRFVSDPGHGWLECPIDSVLLSGAKVSEYSYEDREKGLAYLEEDCDAPAYLKATGRFGEKLAEENSNQDSFVRSLPHYGSACA